MPGGSLISINNLSCSYSLKDEQKVLFIENLELEKGKIFFLLGASGTGKSTLLETLGLMNNTISSGTVIFNYSEENHYDFARLWKDNHQEKINLIRKNFLSFIFQETNLMENFTAYENICLSQMIKSKVDQEQAMNGAIKLMEQVRLPQSEVSFNNLSVNLSGGQRQRVSFVRALNTDFKVLLCDEPTGNLDEVNAHELIQTVKQNLDNEKSAVLVSHDINLALKYADQLVLITKNKEKGYGEIVKKNIFNRSQWESLNDQELSGFRESLVQSFMADHKKEKSKIIPGKANYENAGYRNLFIRKEGKVLLGNSYVNLLILVAIIFITLLAIGFANGTLSYLDTKLNDKYVNWLSIAIPSSLNSQEQVDQFTDNLNDPAIRKAYLIDTVTTYQIRWLPLFSNDTVTDPAIIKGRLLAEDDPLSRDLFNEENLVSGGKGFSGDHDLGIVVTKRLLNDLGYPEDTKIIYFDNQNTDESRTPYSHFRVPVPVRAVVKEIPGKNKFIVTEFFYLSWREKEECVFDFRGDQRKRITLFISDNNRKLTDTLKNELNKNIKAGNFDLKESYADESNESLLSSDSIIEAGGENLQTNDLSIDIHRDTATQVSGPGYELTIEINPIPHLYATTENLYRKIMDLPLFNENKNKMVRIFYYDDAPLQVRKNMYSDYLSVNFKSLDSVDVFSNFFYKALNPDMESLKNANKSNIIEIDSGAIKEKKNFNYISKITILICSLLIIFSILAISLFISNLLKTHLNKVKMNLGTFKAFGLSDRESKNIYLVIMLRFIIFGILASFVLAFLTGSGIQEILKNYIHIEDKITYFKIFDLRTLVLVIIILFVTVLVSYYNVNKILSKTPGDLIYNR